MTGPGARGTNGVERREPRESARAMTALFVESGPREADAFVVRVYERGASLPWTRLRVLRRVFVLRSIDSALSSKNRKFNIEHG
jgi:hypothetical protein